MEIAFVPLVDHELRCTRTFPVVTDGPRPWERILITIDFCHLAGVILQILATYLAVQLLELWIFLADSAEVSSSAMSPCSHAGCQQRQQQPHQDAQFHNFPIN